MCAPYPILKKGDLGFGITNSKLAIKCSSNLVLMFSSGLCDNYTLTDANGSILASGGGNFGGLESNNFCLNGGVVAPRNASFVKHNVSVIPNPAFEKIQINTHLSFETIHSIQIIGAVGRIILENSIQLNTPLSFDISGLQEGIYMVQILSDDGVANTKFVKR